MNFKNHIPRTGLPRFHESSAQRSVRDSDAVPRLWSKSNTTARQLQKTTESVELLRRSVERMRRTRGGGSLSGWSWAEKKKYDKDKFYGEGNVVVIMPTDSIVTIGAVSASSGTEGDTVQAQAGVWVAMQDVAPEDQGGGTFWYHVPHLPLPDETDIDSEQNFWMQITSFCDTAE